MASQNCDRTNTVNPNSGFCSETKIFHSLRPQISLPSETIPLSVADYVFSHLQASSSTAALIDATDGRRISYSEFIHRVKTLAANLRTRLGLSRGDSAYILSPNSIHIPILFYSLFSLGVTISPSNPACTKPEISRQIHLCKPVVAFAASETADKIPSLRYGTVLLDSSEFESMMMTNETVKEYSHRVIVHQSDTATILYSSGTTGSVKGVELTHRNWISVLAGLYAIRDEAETGTPPTVALCSVPYFHVYGFGFCVRVLALGGTLVTMGSGRFDLKRMMRTIEEHRISQVAWTPPIAVAIVKDGNGATNGYDLRSLRVVSCGGAPLRKSVISKLKKQLPNVQLAQAYGLTETTGRVFGTVGFKESEAEGATGKLMSNFQAKVVDPQNGVALPPLTPGELWLKGPFVMKGYVGDKEATNAILDSEGWLKSGDLCYIDNEGYLFFVDRLKELIKYKGYQVAPAELEHLLQTHPDIVDAAVIPFPDEEAGQIPMAYVVKRIGSDITESQIEAFIAKQVAHYKRIRRLVFIDTIPKSAQGKVLRKELIKLALSNPTTSKL